MISAGEVGAIFTIKDDASVVLRAIAAQMNALQVSVDKVATSLKAFHLPRGAAAAIDKMEKAMAAASVTAGSLKGSMGDIGIAADAGATKAAAGFARIDSAIATTQGKLASLRSSLNSVGSPHGNGGIPGVGGRGTGGAHGAPSSHTPLHSNIHAGPVGMRTHDGMMIGGAVAGFSAWEALKANAELQQVQANLLGGGVSREEIEKATGISFEIGGKYGLPARDVLQSINETRNILNKGTTADQGVEAAMHHAPIMAEAMVRLKALPGDKGGDIGKDIYDLVKSAEFRNSIGDKDFDNAIKSMVDASVATGGIVTPKTWLQMSQQLKGALPGLSNDYLYTIMPELAQEFGGRQAGTAGASLYQQLVSGQMRTTGLRLLDQYDKVDKSKVEYDKNGRMVRAEPGFYKDVEAFRSSPMTGMVELIQAFVDKGVSDPNKQRDIMAMIFGNRTANQMATTLAFQGGRLERGAQGIVSAQNSGVGSEWLLNNNPYTQWNEFTAAATNAGASLGGNLMPDATQALKDLTTIVNATGQAMRGDTAKINRGAVEGVLFGNKTSVLRQFADWVATNWGATDGGGSGPHPAPGPRPPAAAGFLGRDPRSPSSGEWTYHPPSAPVTISNIAATLSGPAKVTTGPITLSVSGQSIVAALASEIGAKIEGLFKNMGVAGTNGDSGHDGRESPSYPDHFHGGGH